MVITETKKADALCICWETRMKTLEHLTEKKTCGVKASGGERNRLRDEKAMKIRRSREEKTKERERNTSLRTSLHTHQHHTES